MMGLRARRPTGRRTTWRLVTYGLTAIWATVMLVVFAAADGGRTADLVGGPPTLFFALVGLVAAIRAATLRSLDARTRAAWRSMAVGYGLVFTSSTLFAAVPGFPGPGDYPRLFAVVFFLHGLLSMTRAPRSRAERVRAGLDIGVVLTAGCMAMWYWTLGPLVTMTGVPLHALVLATAYPLADVVLGFGAAAALLRGTHASVRRPMIILTLGLTGLIVADLQYARTGVEYLLVGVGGGVESAPVSQWVFLLSAFSLLAVAAVQQCAGATAETQERPDTQTVARITLLPYVAIGGGYLLLLTTVTGMPLYPWGGLVIGAVAMTGIVVARQVLVIRENAKLLTTDYLTGLSTRAALAAALSRSLSRSQRSGNLTAVLVIDLDGFKAVNDQFGHEAGDELLVGFANRLRGSVSRTDTVGRLGGDEFAVVLTDIGHADHAVAVALRLLDSLRRPLIVAGRPLVGRASIGIALSQPGDTGRLIMHRADQAMYRAKRASTGWSLEGGIPAADAAPAARADPAVSAP